MVSHSELQLFVEMTGKESTTESQRITELRYQSDHSPDREFSVALCDSVVYFFDVGIKGQIWWLMSVRTRPDHFPLQTKIDPSPCLRSETNHALSFIL